MKQNELRKAIADGIFDAFSKAAKLLGLDGIGIDISEKYITGAKNRLENCSSEKDKFEREIALHTVKETFKEKKARGMYKERKNEPGNYN